MTKLKLSLTTAILSLLILLFWSTSFAQTVDVDDLGNTTNKSIAEFLDENGQFHNPEEYEGSLDVSEYMMRDKDNDGSLFTSKYADDPFWNSPR